MALPTQKEIDDAKRSELFLDFGDAPLDPSDDEPEKLDEHLHHTDEMPPGSGNFDWATIRAGLVQHRIAKGRSADGAKVARVRVESDEDAVTIIEAANAIDVVDLPQSPRLISERAIEKNWEIRAARSATHRAAVLYQADSKESNANEYRRGDVNTPAEDRVHFQIEGRLVDGARVLATFRLTYEQRDGKNAFKFAHVWDIIGKGDIARKAGEFEEWFGILAPKPETKKKATEQDLLEGGTWNG